MLTQLSGAMPTVFVSHLNTIILIMDNLFAIYFVNNKQQQYAPYNIGHNNRANTFISKFVSHGFH